MDWNNPQHLDERARTFRQMGRGEEARGLEEKAATLRAEQNREGAQRVTKDGVETRENLPGEYLRKKQNEINDAHVKHNQTVLDEAHAASLAAEQMLPELNKYERTIFDADGKPKTTMGPLHQVIGPAVALATQLNMPPEWIEALTGVNNPVATAAEKARLGLASTLANTNFGNNKTQAEFFANYNNATPGIQQDAIAAKYIIDTLREKAQFDARQYEHLAPQFRQDPVGNDLRMSRLRYYRENNMYNPNTTVVPKKEAPAAAAPTPNDVPEALRGIEGIQRSPDGQLWGDPKTGIIYGLDGKPTGAKMPPRRP
jgi:hypothetical protein